MAREYDLLLSYLDSDIWPSEIIKRLLKTYASVLSEEQKVAFVEDMKEALEEAYRFGTDLAQED